MTLFRMFDASKPPLTAPAGCSAVAGYIGPPPGAPLPSHTPHVWTGPEWRRFAHLSQFPIWVPGPAVGQLDDPIQVAREAATATHARGWVPFYGGSQAYWRAIIYDMETAAGAVGRIWCAAVQDETLEQGYQPVGYGSLATVLGLGFSIVWAAAWDGIPQLEAGQTVEAHQFTDKGGGGAYDLSVVTSAFLKHGGIGPRTGT